MVRIGLFVIANLLQELMGNPPVGVKVGVLRVIKRRSQSNLTRWRTITREINLIKGFPSAEVLLEGGFSILKPLVISNRDQRVAIPFVTRSRSSVSN
jgi:hypothetical protein